jgi:ribosomal protein S17
MLFSWIPKSSSPRKPQKVSVIGKMLGLDSKPPPKLLKETTLTKNALSPEMFPSGEESSSKWIYCRGMVISTKMTNTVVIRRNYLHYVKKYKRFEKRHKNISCHISPCFNVKEGDIVIAGQCRPLSKTVRFNVLKVQPNDIIGTARKQFNLFWHILSN